MILKTPPETSGSIRARLAYLRNRKMVIDELIVCLERYAGHTPRLHGPELRLHFAQGRSRPLDGHCIKLAGAA